MTGRSIGFQDVTPHEFAQAAIERGTPPEQAQLMERLNEVFRARRWVDITDDVENITGTAPATFRDWCERHADAFRWGSPQHVSTVNDIAVLGLPGPGLAGITKTG